MLIFFKTILLKSCELPENCTDAVKVNIMKYLIPFSVYDLLLSFKKSIKLNLCSFSPENL